MDEKEIRIQMAIGSLPTAPTLLATIVRNTDSVELVQWALKHNHSRVRAAAMRNKLLPTTDFMRTALFDRTVLVQEAVHTSINDSYRRTALENVLNFQPQLELELDFDDEES